MGTSYFKFKQDELPIVGDLLVKLLKKDLKKFEDFSPEFNDLYVKALQDQIQTVRNLTLAPELTAEIKKVSNDLGKCIKEIKPLLDKLAVYVQRTNKNLSVPFANFGIREAKAELRRKKAGAYCACMDLVHQNIEKNMQALKEKGYKEKVDKELQEKTNKAFELYTTQQEKMEERKRIVSENHAEFDKLWSMMHDISKVGKLVVSKKKVEQYMFTNILKEVRKPKRIVKKVRNLRRPVASPVTSIVEEKVEEKA